MTDRFALIPWHARLRNLIARKLYDLAFWITWDADDPA